jgi:hypothetical protein
MKTLKYEEVHPEEYRDLLEARVFDSSIFWSAYTNQKRLHSELSYRPPVEFKNNLRQRPPGPPRMKTGSIGPMRSES